ncbi:hypothetical protein A8B98_06480 [Hymenobacter sp. UV11]|nr:hypothetical protein A8B98_06480 [Hymenobacter sp. UV11]
MLHAQLVDLLSQPESFCCVDLHLPTDVEKLHAFHRLGARQLFVQCHEVRQRGERHLHRHLLHTKLLLFDLPLGQAEVWVGSYNFTKQALLGANREASVVLTTTQGSALYQQVRAYLEAIRADAHCHRFDPARLDDYKKLQGLPDDEPEPECLVLPVAWHSARMPTLARQTLLLLGQAPDERRALAQADAANTPVVLRAYDLSTGLTTHYGVVIQNQGAIDRNVPSSYDLSFGQRHLAVRPPETLPYVAPQLHPLPPAELREFGFWASLLVLDKLPAALHLLPRERDETAHWQRDWQATEEVRTHLEAAPEALNQQLTLPFGERPPGSGRPPRGAARPAGRAVAKLGDGKLGALPPQSQAGKARRIWRRLLGRARARPAHRFQGAGQPVFSLQPALSSGGVRTAPAPALLRAGQHRPATRPGWGPGTTAEKATGEVPAPLLIY